MRKKKREKRDSICVVYEGYREGYLLEYLAENSKVKLNGIHCSGGTAGSITITAIKHSYRECKVYAFFDGDFKGKLGSQITVETFETLADLWKLKATNLQNQPYRQLQNINKNKRNPIFIVSNPNSIEGLLLQICGKPLNSLAAKTTEQLKKVLDGLIDKCVPTKEDSAKMFLIDKKIKKYENEMQNVSIPEKKFFQSKIREEDRKKSRVKFKRFLYQTLPITKIASIRSNIPEIALLPDAFQL